MDILQLFLFIKATQIFNIEHEIVRREPKGKDFFHEKQTLNPFLAISPK